MGAATRLAQRSRGLALRPRLGRAAGTGRGTLSTSRRIEVAAGLLLQPDGRVLLARRPQGKPYAGYWEFPGGKAEPGEALDQALARELHEELGVRVRTAYPWLVREHVYPHGHVRLQFFRVTRWEGEPQPHEAQELAWQPRDAIAVRPLLPANAPVLRALALPHRILLTQAGTLGVAGQLAALERALAQGPALVMVREPGMEAAMLDRLIREVGTRCAAAGVPWVVNGDAQRARAAGAGLHLKSAALRALERRPDGFSLVGASCHDATELALAARWELDYALLGPVLPTPTHPGVPGMGWDALAATVAGSGVPVFAIGGMDDTHLAQAWTCGAHGIAQLRAAWRT